MTDTVNKNNNARCPDQEQLSAYADRELAPAVARDVAAHILVCDTCARHVVAIEHLSRAFRDLPRGQVGFDIYPPVELAIARAARQQRLAGVWRIAPLSLAAAATVVLGVFIGTMLTDSPAPRENAVPLAMFDAIPPGGVCIGFDSCYPRGRL